VRHYIVDPGNEDRLLKIPPSVVAEIQADALREARAAIEEEYPVGLAQQQFKAIAITAINELLEDTHITNITKEPNDG
jgi:hypothetical protein